MADNAIKVPPGGVSDVTVASKDVGSGVQAQRVSVIGASGIKSTRVTVTTTRASLISSALAGRNFLSIQHESGSPVRIDDGVITQGQGWLMKAPGEFARAWGPAVDVKVSTDTGTAVLNVFEEV